MDTKRRDKVWFANKYIAFLEKEFGRTKESYYAFFDNDDFPNECWGLGFNMDCGKSFINAYGEDAWNNIKGLKTDIEKISDINTIGNGLFSKWRYYNHWAYPSEITPETKDWFLTLFRRLKVLCDTQEGHYWK